MENLLNFVSSISTKLGLSESPIGEAESQVFNFYGKQSLPVKIEIHILKSLIFKRFFKEAQNTGFQSAEMDYCAFVVAIALAKSQKSTMNLRGIDVSIDKLPDFDRAFMESLKMPKNGPRKATKDILIAHQGSINRMRSEGISWGKIIQYLKLKHKIKIADTTLMRNFAEKSALAPEPVTTPEPTLNLTR